ncbi:hypothetical protein LCGC14_3067920, partial [marine sediment metagenome]
MLTHCPFDPTPGSKNWDPKSNGSKEYKGDAQKTTHLSRAGA